MAEARLDYITSQANSDFAPPWRDAKASLLALLMELDAQRRENERLQLQLQAKPVTCEKCHGSGVMDHGN